MRTNFLSHWLCKSLKPVICFKVRCIEQFLTTTFNAMMRRFCAHNFPKLQATMLRVFLRSFKKRAAVATKSFVKNNCSVQEPIFMGSCSVSVYYMTQLFNATQSLKFVPCNIILVSIFWNITRNNCWKPMAECPNILRNAGWEKGLLGFNTGANKPEGIILWQKFENIGVSPSITNQVCSKCVGLLWFIVSHCCRGRQTAFIISVKVTFLWLKEYSITTGLCERQCHSFFFFWLTEIRNRGSLCESLEIFSVRV